MPIIPIKRSSTTIIDNPLPLIIPSKEPIIDIDSKQIDGVMVDTKYKPSSSQIDGTIRDNKKRKLAIVTILCGDPKYQEVFDLTYPRLEAYARKCKATPIVWRSYENHVHPFFQKRELATLLLKYDRVLYVDCDIFIKRSAPNIFKLTPYDSLCMCDEYRPDCDDWIKWDIGKYGRIIKRLENKVITSADYQGRYYNAGLILASKLHIDLFNNAYLPEIIFYFIDQDWFNFLIAWKKPKMFNIGDQFDAMFHIPNLLDRLTEFHFIHANQNFDKLDLKIRKVKEVADALEKIGE